MAEISVNNFQKAIMESLREYGDVVYKATNESLGAAEKVLIKNLKSSSPKKTGDYAKHWQGTGKKYKLARYVGNTTTVKGPKSNTIPLSNVLEYYKHSPHKGEIQETYNKSVDEMATAAVAEIKKGV